MAMKVDGSDWRQVMAKHFHGVTRREVWQMLDKGASVRGIATAAGVSRREAQAWCDRRRSGGESIMLNADQWHSVRQLT